jgi:hypothetical protein
LACFGCGLGDLIDEEACCGAFAAFDACALLVRFFFHISEHVAL